MSVARVGNEGTVSVRDDGIGFDLESALYGSNLREKAEVPSTDQGAGIGLTIVKEIVELLNGTLSASKGGPDGGMTVSARFDTAQ